MSSNERFKRKHQDDDAQSDLVTSLTTTPLLVDWIDVSILVGGKTIAAHRNVLSTQSPVFAACLTESNQLEITDIKPTIFEMLLRFLYTGKVPLLLERQTATELMAAAKKYEVNGLRKYLIGPIVAQLPEPCLLALFRQMTLQDQIGARKVCRRWADLMLETTSKRHELILLLGKNPIKDFEDQIDCALFGSQPSLKLLLNLDGTAMYPTRRLTSWNSLHMDSLDQASAEQIASTFTAATNFQVTALDTSPSSADNLGHLLERWSHQLVTLQLFESLELVPEEADFDYDLPTFPQLFAAINTQSALKYLHMHLFDMPVPDLSIISQLIELHFNSFRITSSEFAQWLQQYGEGNQSLARIKYESDDNFQESLEPLMALSEHLRQRFTLFTCDTIHDPALLCAHFDGLTSLTLNPSSSITIRHLFAHLTTLHQLIHFSITSSFSFPADNLKHLQLPQVKSVKALELKLYQSGNIHQELAKLKLNWTLPNVEVIAFDLQFKCTECHIENFKQPSEQAKFCLRKLFAPLKRDCAKLRLIQHDREQVHGTAEELLAE